MIVERSHEAARSAAGLVLVPTTHAQRAGLSEAIRRGDSEDLRKALGAFKIDPQATMVPRLRRAVGFAARAHALNRKGHRSEVCHMVTLTYADADGWKPDHMTTAMNRMRDWCRRRGIVFRYVWVAEIQPQRFMTSGQAVIHYHVALWLPRGVACPHFDSSGWWPHGMTRSEVAKHATGYLMSYLKKGSHDLPFPKGSRRYGVGGLDHSLRRARRWLGLPAFVQGNSSIHDRWERAVGGGWRAPDGRVVPSEFERVFVGDGYALRRIHAHPRAIEAAGPFCWLTDRAIAMGGLQ